MRISPRAFALAVSGLGLIFLGVALLLFIPLNRWKNDSASATDFSAIPAEVRFDAPSLSLRDVQGDPHSLSDYRGRVVLVNLWATWCPPCKAEMPILQKFYLKHQNEGFVVIAIEDGDPAPAVIAFVDDLGLTFPVWLDPTYQATERAFKTMNLPSSYVIDRTGKIRLRWVGAISQENLERYLPALIKE